MSEANLSKEKLAWLQVLRAIAALGIVAFHARTFVAATVGLPSWLDAVARYGFFGVDIFFVLSGVVVGTSAQAVHNPGSAFRFVMKRFLRIFTGYWPVLLLLLIVGRWTGETFDPAFGFRSVFLLEPRHAHNWLSVAWSLTYELYFYLLIAAGYALFPHHRDRMLALVIASLLAWSTAWWAFGRAAVFSGNEPFRFLLSPLCVEFFAGVALARAMARDRAFASAPQSLLLGGCLAIVGVVAGTSSDMFANIPLLRLATLGVGGFGLVLLALAAEHGTLRPPRWLVKIGDASFALYLIHLMWLAVLSKTYQTYGCAPSVFGCNLAVLLGVFAVVPIAYVWFIALERPLYERALALHKLKIFVPLSR